MAFKTINRIIDGNTIEVSENWSVNDLQVKSGNLVRVNGYNLPFLPKLKVEDVTDQQELFKILTSITKNLIAKERLKNLLIPKDIPAIQVELRNPIKILKETIDNKEQNILICDVILNRINIANYFPEYKEEFSKA